LTAVIRRGVAGIKGDIQVSKVLIPSHTGRPVVAGGVLIACPEAVDIELDTFFFDPTEDHAA